MHAEEKDDEDPAKNTNASCVAVPQQMPQAGDPERRRERMHDQCLHQDEADPTQLGIAPAGLDVVQELDRWKAAANFPNQIRQKDEQSNQAAEPNPGLREVAALFC